LGTIIYDVTYVHNGRVVAKPNVIGGRRCYCWIWL